MVNHQLQSAIQSKSKIYNLPVLKQLEDSQKGLVLQINKPVILL